MQGKIVCALALVAILVIIDPATGCKLCGGGGQWCTCTNAISAPPRPYYSRSWEDNGPAPLHLTVPVIQPPSLGLGLGGLGGIGGLGGGNLCGLCGGYNRGYPGYSSREDYGGYSRGYSCRCAPRRNRYRYDDY